jgi:hypothetical protein
MFILFCEYMFSYYLFPFIMLFNTSSMFELHVVVSIVVMFTIRLRICGPLSLVPPAVVPASDPGGKS